MILDRESARSKLMILPRAARNVVHAPARRALEMVVMRRFRRLIARNLSRQRDHLYGAVGHEHFEIPVNRGQAERGDDRSCAFEHFLRRKRPLCRIVPVSAFAEVVA